MQLMTMPISDTRICDQGLHHLLTEKYYSDLYQFLTQEYPAKVSTILDTGICALGLSQPLIQEFAAEVATNFRHCNMQQRSLSTSDKGISSRGLCQHLVQEFSLVLCYNITETLREQLRIFRCLEKHWRDKLPH
jgi:hypothetical protein